MTDKEGWAIFEQAMVLLEDVPGDTMLERIERLKAWYLDLQMLVGNLKHRLEVASSTYTREQDQKIRDAAESSQESEQ